MLRLFSLLCIKNGKYICTCVNKFYDSLCLPGRDFVTRLDFFGFVIPPYSIKKQYMYVNSPHCLFPISIYIRVSMIPLVYRPATINFATALKQCNFVYFSVLNILLYRVALMLFQMSTLLKPLWVELSFFRVSNGRVGDLHMLIRMAWQMTQNSSCSFARVRYIAHRWFVSIAGSLSCKNCSSWFEYRNRLR